MNEAKSSRRENPRQTLYTSLLLLLIALICMTAATTAWLTLGNHTRVYSLAMDVTAGANLRFDLDPHPAIDQYVQTLNFASIASRIQLEKGFDPTETPLMPVTTEDYAIFMNEKREVVDVKSGDYLEFTLHFMATKDMIVHLTSANSEGKDDGTRIGSNVQTLPAAMRISFTDGNKMVVYDPGLGDETVILHDARNFSLPKADSMVYSESNALFSLEEGVNKPIIVRVWMEGTDEACNDELQKATYNIVLRFEGTDENHVVFSRNPHTA